MMWPGKYFVATLRGNHLHMIYFDLENKNVILHKRLFQGEFGRLRDVATGPDGFLYILTSNLDGRGLPDATDDKILRIVPLDKEIDNFESCICWKLNYQIISKTCLTQDSKYFVEHVSNIPDLVRKRCKVVVSDTDFR